MDRVKIREILSEKLHEKRMEHTLGVEYTATALAMRYGVNLEQAALAGLLHDCAKYLSREKKIQKCEELKIPISDSERKNPELLHAKLGAYYAKNKYGVEDQAVLDAIASHTTGKPEMTTLEKIIYVADYIEPNRNKAPKLALLRMMAFQDLDECLLEILENTLIFLTSTDSEIDEITVKTYEYYKKIRKPDR
ncbi:MAG TPA: bis(5'-nucleosyl)-tetraphosphatase (symmetrical) YqeK [Candidatus Scybalomonas excrementigallinarum]|nr:bis(5'-nucleosyl)-tetraphosphatase (symmetrical) YqeK [Candidatus Scybalomonas excrementigallinarum]